MWVGENLNVLGNLNVFGNFTRLNTTNIVIDDPLIVLGLNASANQHTGFLNRYVDNSEYKFTGLVKENSDTNKNYHLFTNIDDKLKEEKPLLSTSGSNLGLNELNNKDTHNLVVAKMNILNDDDLDGSDYTDGNALSSTTAKTIASVNVEGSLCSKKYINRDSKGIYFGDEKKKY